MASAVEVNVYAGSAFNGHGNSPVDAGPHRDLASSYGDTRSVADPCCNADTDSLACSGDQGL